MAVRTGAQYRRGLADDRQVWLGGRVVEVTTEPAFAGSINGIAGYFDWQNRFPDDCLVAETSAGAPMSASLILPRSAADLAARRRCFDRLAKYSFGMLGRTPDYVNVSLAGFVACGDLFSDGTSRPAARLNAFYREVVDGDLALTHALIPPSIDRAAGDYAGLNADLAMRVVRRTRDHVVVRGARMLATLAPFADEMFVYPQLPLPHSADPHHALCFSIPMGTRGLITLCRDHFGLAADPRDRPFSTRFDEQDGFVIFDDVEIPLERLFIDCDVEIYNRMNGAARMANAYQQTTIRAANKLEFVHELGTAMTGVMNASARQDYTAMLGEIWAYAQLTRSAIVAAEAGASDWGNGAFFCDDRPLRAIRDVMPSWMARANQVLKAIGSHNLLVTPSVAAFENPAMAELIERYLPGANGMSARERARIFRTAWDFAGSALGGRNELYEMFYLAGQARNFTRDHLQAAAAHGFGDLLDTFLTDLNDESGRTKTVRDSE